MLLAFILLILYFLVSRYAVTYFVLNIYWPLPPENQWNDLAHKWRKENLVFLMIPILGEFLGACFLFDNITKLLVTYLIRKIDKNG